MYKITVKKSLNEENIGVQFMADGDNEGGESDKKWQKKMRKETVIYKNA